MSINGKAVVPGGRADSQYLRVEADSMSGAGLHFETQCKGRANSVAMSLRPVHRCECPHCKEVGELFAPMVSTRPGAFTLRCLLDECNRMRAFYYLNGQINIELSGRGIRYYTEFKLKRGYLEASADMIRDAVDLHLIGQMNTDQGAKDAAYRGAAVHLRIAAQLFAGYILEMNESELRNHALGPLIGRIRKGDRWPRIKKGQQSTILSSLGYLLNLGDTAAHPLLKDPRSEVPPTRGNLERGFDEFDKIADALIIP